MRLGIQPKANPLDVADDLRLQSTPLRRIGQWLRNQAWAGGPAVTTTWTRFGASGIASRVRRTTGRDAWTSWRADCSVGAPITSRWSSQWQQVAVPSQREEAVSGRVRASRSWSSLHTAPPRLE